MKYSWRVPRASSAVLVQQSASEEMLAVGKPSPFLLPSTQTSPFHHSPVFSSMQALKSSIISRALQLGSVPESTCKQLEDAAAALSLPAVVCAKAWLIRRCTGLGLRPSTRAAAPLFRASSPSRPALLPILASAVVGITEQSSARPLLAGGRCLGNL